MPLLLWVIVRGSGLGLLGSSRQLLVVVGIGLGLVIAGAALGSGTARFFAVLLGVPFGLPVSWQLRSEPALLRRHARWLVDFLREEPRGCNTPGGHLAYGVIAVKKLLKETALRRERRTPGLRALARRRSRLVGQVRRMSRRTFEMLCRGDGRAAELSRREHGISQELAQIEAELFRRRLEIQNGVVAAFLRAAEQVWRVEAVRGPASEDDRRRWRTLLGELQQPAGEPPALLPAGLVRGPRAVAFEYGMFFGRIALALLFTFTARPPFLLLSVLLFLLDLYVVEPVVFKLHLQAMTLLLEVRGHKMGDCRSQIEALTGGDRVFRFPIIVPKFSSNPAATQLAAIIDAAVARSGIKPVRVTPFAMRTGVRRTVLELSEANAPELERRGAALCAALRAELDARRALFPLDVALETDGRLVNLVLTSPDQRIWDMIGEDANQAFLYLRKNLRALADTLDHLGPRFVPVFILASNSRDPDVVQYEIDHLAELQGWSNAQHAGQVGFLYLLRGGAWYSYNAQLRRFEAGDKDFVAAFPGDGAERAQLARTLNQQLGDPELHRQFAGFDFDSLPAHRQPGAVTRERLERRRAGQRLTPREQLELNRELLYTRLPMRGSGGFFKKVGNDVAAHELLVLGKTRPTVYTDRRVHEHVQDASLPNYRQVWGDFARYTGLRGSNQQIQDAILAGEDLVVDSVPELAAIVDDKNSLAPGELEKGLATMLHPENQHIVIGVPRIEVTLPEDHEGPTSSAFVRDVQAAREIHNAADGLTRAGLFEHSSAAFGKWFMRPRAYFAHYAGEALNAAHALSHDFQQSYLVAGAAGGLGALTEVLCGPSRFEVRCVVPGGGA